MYHSEAIEVLNVKVEAITEQIRVSKGDRDLITHKESLLMSIKILKLLSSSEIKPTAKVIQLPLPINTGHFSEFRVLDDGESEDRDCWSEVSVNGEKVRAIVGDLVILNSKSS